MINEVGTMQEAKLLTRARVHHYAGRFYRQILSRFNRNNLSRLAQVFGSDKFGKHFYTPHYEFHFAPIQRKRLTILEIGIGGYENRYKGGGSLRMWKSYFPGSRIYGIDLFDKSELDERRIKTFRGDQTDETFLRDVVLAETGPPDIIIDDGSHINSHVITTFRILFPHLAEKGIYVVEDTQTSYWENVLDVDWGGSTDLDAVHTSMNFFKSLIDGLNHEEFAAPIRDPDYFDRHIVAMHFYHNLIFIEKGENNEGSNVIKRRDAA